MHETETATQPTTGGDAVHEVLRAAGVDCVFGVPSQHNLALYDSLCRHGSIRVVGTRHEQGAVHAADGYARATGRLGVAIVSTGPGTANAVNGLYEAGYASSPVLLITTQVDSRYLGKGKGFIHDAEGQLAMLSAVTRRSTRVQRADEIADTLLHLIGDILRGRPQPGAIEIPTDLLAAPVSLPLLRFSTPAPLEVSATDLDKAAALLGNSKRPLLWVGGGCINADASTGVQALAEMLGAPVVSSINGRGAMPPGHPLYLGAITHTPAFPGLLQNTDLVVAIGTRFQALASQYWQLPMPRLLHIDADADVPGRNFKAELAIAGDARLAVSGLLERVMARDPDTDFLARARDTRDAARAGLRAVIGEDHQRLVDIIEQTLPADCPVVGDATTVANTWGNHLLPIRGPRLGHYSTSLAIGPALPLGLGAALGTGRKTLVLHGDGGVMLNIAELATAVEQRAPLVVCVFNDRGYAVLKGLQRATTGREFAVDLHTPDFVALAEAMGMPGRMVDSCGGFEAALRDALDSKGPYLIEIDLDSLAPIRMFG